MKLIYNYYNWASAGGNMSNFKNVENGLGIKVLNGFWFTDRLHIQYRSS